MSALLMSARRVSLIAENTFREAVRQRFLPMLSLGALALGIIAWSLRGCSVGAPPTKFLLDVGFGFLTFFGSLLAIVATAGSFSAEMDRGTALTVLARPVRRSEFVMGKLVGILTLLLLFCSACTGALLGLAEWLQMGPSDAMTGQFAGAGRVSAAAVGICGLVHWFRCCVLAALTLMVSCYARSSLLAVTSGFAALVACSLQGLLCNAIRASGEGWGKCLAELVGCILPDFSLYDVADRVAGGGALSAIYVAGVAFYSAIYAGLFLALSVFWFRRREL